MSQDNFPPKLHWIKAPPVFQDDDQKLRARTMIFLISVLLTAASILGYIAWQRNLKEALAGLLVAIAILIISLWSTLRGKLKLPSYLLPLGLVIVNTYIVYNGQGIHDITILGYPMLVALGGLLLGKRGALNMAILSGLCLSGIYVAEEMGFLPDATFSELTAFDDIFTMGILLGVTALFIYFAMRNLSSSLERARMSEQELRQLNDELEKRVSERTSELQAANEHLTILSKVKDEFVSNVSHELRTPITSIKLYHDMLEKKPKAVTQYIVHMKRETDRLARLIDDLLFLSRLDQNRTEMIFGWVDLNLLVKDLVADRIPLAESRQLLLNSDIQADIPPVWADERMISQVLSILLTNAFTYTPPGGDVKVFTHYKEDDNLLLVGFSVCDNGYGITEEECKRLFERFYRGRAAQNANTNGAGLGLAIAKEIVERNNGKIEVQSEGSPGKGTTFTVWLPTQDKPNSQV